MRITNSARKHGVSDADILHALRNALRDPIDLEDSKTLYIGSSHDGAPLEVIVIEDHDPRVIHAMQARPKYWP